MFVLPGITAILPHSWGDSIDPHSPLSAGTDILTIHHDPVRLGMARLPPVPRIRPGRIGPQCSCWCAGTSENPAATPVGAIRSRCDSRRRHRVDRDRGAERGELLA
jgi:hypothetical protein